MLGTLGTRSEDGTEPPCRERFLEEDVGATQLAWSGKQQANCNELVFLVFAHQLKFLLDSSLLKTCTVSSQLKPPQGAEHDFRHIIAVNAQALSERTTCSVQKMW